MLPLSYRAADPLLISILHQAGCLGWEDITYLYAEFQTRSWDSACQLPATVLMDPAACDNLPRPCLKAESEVGADTQESGALIQELQCYVITIWH